MEKYKKQILLLSLIIVKTFYCFSQSQSTVIGNNTFSFPVLSTTAINNIPSPTLGMFVFDQTLGCLKHYNGAAWSCVGSKPAFNIYASNVTLTAANDYVLFTASPPLNSPRFFITLPAASTMPGKVFTIINHSFSTLDCSPYRFGNSASNFNDITDNTEVYLISDGTNWRKFN